MTDAELEAYYSNLLIAQYSNKGNAIATIQTFVSEIVANQIIQQVEDGFNLATAIGVQLDMIAQYKGAERIQFGLNLGREFFAMPSIDDADPDSFKGFALAADAATLNWYFQVIEDITRPSQLTDQDMRSFIGYLAAIQGSGFGLGEIDQILYAFFGNYVTLTDNGDMTIDYVDDPSDPSDLFKIVAYTDTLPRPAGVQLNIS